MKTLNDQRGSALVEAAIIFPCLILIVMWSAAITDILVLKLKASEAARFSLWETTVFRTPQQIDTDVQARFVDLRSPSAINISYTGLMMYPLASNIQWKATVDTTSQKVSLGNLRPPPGNNPLQTFISLIIGAVVHGTSSPHRAPVSWRPGFVSSMIGTICVGATFQLAFP